MATMHCTRRGNCLFQALAALAVLIVIFGIVSMLTSGAGDAVKDFEKQVQSLTDTATTIKAPGQTSIEMKQGGAMVAVLPSGDVAGEKIGAPKAGVTFTVTVTDPSGNPVKFEKGNQSPQAGAPFELLGVFEAKSEGAYKVDVQSSDGSPAAIMVAAGTQEDIDRAMNSGLAILQGVGGGCLTICGAGAAVVFGGVALFMRLRKPKPDPLEHL
ncbi:MAG: hypothetical protein LW636_11590 [Planctomycetaceae bacterium]|nr:hypothetical protein [Planctomycetaceae bacterium]